MSGIEWIVEKVSEQILESGESSMLSEVDFSAVIWLGQTAFNGDSLNAYMIALASIQQEFDMSLRGNKPAIQGEITKHGEKVKNLFLNHLTKEMTK